LSVRKSFTDSEIAYIRDNYKTLTVKKIAENLGRSPSSIRQRCMKLRESDAAMRKIHIQIPDDLEERFKNPLLRVAVRREALPDDWTPINRLDELWMYEGRYERIADSDLEGTCET